MSVEQRLNRLERQNRLYRNLFIFAGLIAVAWISWGQTQPIPAVIQARSFAVMNERGLKTAEFTATPSGGLLRTYARGTYANSVLIGQSPSGGGVIEVFSKYGTATFSINGEGVMILKNRAGEDVVFMGEDSEGHGMLDLYDKAGDFVFQAAHGPNGGQMLLYNNAGDIAVRADAGPSGAGQLHLCRPGEPQCQSLHSKP